jgi:hypothetical protein
MDEISAPSADRRVIDHSANEPESPKPDHPSTYDRELERITRARAYFDDHSLFNAAIRKGPTGAMFAAAAIGFIGALIVRR